LAAADPYCPELRRIAIDAARAEGITVHETGTVVVIQGPRFSTKAESREFASHGWEVINMTQYPEGILARELGICYVNVALITDYDAGLEGHPEVEAVTHEAVLKVFAENNNKLKGLLLRMIDAIPVGEPAACRCSQR
jgi:5'-methylthioadenosine phosphorylase